jgi:hypothetical protein
LREDVGIVDLRNVGQDQHLFPHLLGLVEQRTECFELLSLLGVIGRDCVLAVPVLERIGRESNQAVSIRDVGETRRGTAGAGVAGRQIVQLHTGLVIVQLLLQIVDKLVEIAERDAVGVLMGDVVIAGHQIDFLQGAGAQGLG